MHHIHKSEIFLKYQSSFHTRLILKSLIDFIKLNRIFNFDLVLLILVLHIDEIKPETQKKT